MSTHVHVHCCGPNPGQIVSLLEAIMATQQELAAQVAAVTDKLNKIGTETRALLTKIDELTAAVQSAGSVTPELQAAVDALAAQADVVDQLVPDSPTP